VTLVLFGHPLGRILARRALFSLLRLPFPSSPSTYSLSNSVIAHSLAAVLVLPCGELTRQLLAARQAPAHHQRRLHYSFPARSDLSAHSTYSPCVTSHVPPPAPVAPHRVPTAISSPSPSPLYRSLSPTPPPSPWSHVSPQHTVTTEEEDVHVVDQTFRSIYWVTAKATVEKRTTAPI